MKLQTKILGLLIPLIILPMLLVGYMAYYQINSIAVKNAEEHIETLLNQIKFNIKTHINRANTNLEFISQDSLLQQYINANEAQRYSLFYKPLVKWLQSFKASESEYLEIKVLLKDGYEDIHIIADGIKSPSTKDTAPQLYKSIKSRPLETHVSLAKLPGKETGVALISTPLFSIDDSRKKILWGHLVLAMDLGFINEIPMSDSDGASPDLIISNNQGLAYFESNRALNEFSKRLSRSNIRTKHINRLIQTHHSGETILAVTYNIESNIYATGFISKNKLTAGADELNKMVIMMTIGIVITFAVVLFSVIRTLVTRPIEKLNHYTQAMAEGDMANLIEIDQDDEVGELAKAFDSMRTNLKASTEQIEELAYYDTLTGLPNKITFLETIQHFLAHAEENSEVIAVLFFDLDNFKNINDGLGHDMGDQLLLEVSNRLKDCIRATDIMERATNLPAETQSHLIARMGGDEFTLVLSQINTIEEASKVAVRILSKLSQPFILTDHEIYIGASIGIACYPHDGNTPEMLLKHADIAMYEAKARGKNNFQYFDHKMNEPVSERLALESSMRAALENHEFRIVFQPRVPLNSTNRYEFEALIRWQHPEKGFISPGLFIPVAEETGFIQHVGDWMLEQACAQIKRWLQAGYEDVVVSINLSPVQFNYGSPSNSVRNTLSKYDLHPKHLELEITESGLMQNENTAANILNALKEIGVSIALDDFGTGYSSLAYLLRFPIDTLKIDRAFIRNLTKNKQAVLVLKTITELAKSLELETVAEGVETEDQLDIVQSMGCHTIQGFLFAKPSSAEEAMAFFDNFYQQKNADQSQNG
ncbi:MAG: EAL domain-containing protein [Pseudomonadales bacterium]|nr:EAL domain-containing protein [Pseudomonadales bacterium]